MCKDKIVEMDEDCMFDYLTKEMYLDCLLKRPMSEFFMLS